MAPGLSDRRVGVWAHWVDKGRRGTVLQRWEGSTCLRDVVDTSQSGITGQLTCPPTGEFPSHKTRHTVVVCDDDNNDNDYDNDDDVVWLPILRTEEEKKKKRRRPVECLHLSANK